MNHNQEEDNINELIRVYGYALSIEKMIHSMEHHLNNISIESKQFNVMLDALKRRKTILNSAVEDCKTISKNLKRGLKGEF